MVRILGFVLLAAAYCSTLIAYWLIHSPGAVDHRTHIRYMAWGNPDQQATDYALLQRFEELNPDIKVEFILVAGDYPRKLQIMLAADAEPDVYKLDLYYLPKYFPYGYFLSLNELDEKDPDFSFDDFFPITKNELTYQGKIYGLNTLFGGKILYYNKKMFADAGLPDPYEQYKRGEWNMDAFLNAAKAMTVRDANGVKQFGLKLESSDLWWIMWGFGGDILDKGHNVYIDSPQSLAALKFYSSLLHEHRVMPRPGEDSGGVFAFESGRLGMVSGFAGEAPRLRRRVSGFDWDIVPVPAGPAGRFSLLKGNGLIISSRTKHVDASWKLIKFLNSPEGEMAYSGPKLRRAIPTRISVSKLPQYLESGGKPPYNTATFLELHHSGHQLPVTSQWSEWSQEMSRWMDRMHRGTATPEAVSRGVAIEMRRVLGTPTSPPEKPWLVQGASTEPATTTHAQGANP